MLSRADVADIFVQAHVPQAAAWEIAIARTPDYLEAMDKASVRRDAEELLAQYVEMRRRLELCGCRIDRGRVPT